MVIMILPIFLYCIYTDKNIGVTNENDISSMSNFILAGGLVLMTILLFYSAEGVVITGRNIASELNISDTIVGLVLIAIGTSLPELAATMAAIIKKIYWSSSKWFLSKSDIGCVTPFSKAHCRFADKAEH